MIRSKEIGLRKVIGASKKLMVQFLVESVVLAFLAFILALLLSTSLLPIMNNITGKEMRLLSFDNAILIILFLLCSL